MKKLMALILALCMVCALVVTASATESSVGLNDDDVEISDNGNWSSPKIVVTFKLQPVRDYDREAILKLAKEAGYDTDKATVVVGKILKIGGESGESEVTANNVSASVSASVIRDFFAKLLNRQEESHAVTLSQTGSVTRDDITITDMNQKLKIRFSLPGASGSVLALTSFSGQWKNDGKVAGSLADGKVYLSFTNTINEVLQVPENTRMFAVVVSSTSTTPGGTTGGTTKPGTTDVVAPKTNDLPVIAMLTVGVIGFAGIAVAAKRRKV